MYNPITVQAQDRIEWLDALRGVASILVVLLHYYHHILLALVPMMPGGTPLIQSFLERRVIFHTIDFYKETSFYETIGTLTPWIYGYWDLGKIGVVSFFFISGYVIAYTLGKLKEKPLENFVLSRFFRLYPVFWAALLLMLCLRLLSGHMYPIGQILANLTMFNKFFLISDINGVAWTLQIELTFYILAACFMVKGLLRKSAIISVIIYLFLAVALVLGIAKAYTGIDFPLAFPLGLSVMFTGWYWRISHENPMDLSQRNVAMVALSFIPIWAVIFKVGYAGQSLIYFNSYFLAMILVLLFAFFKVRHPVLRFLGNISYALYLIHDVLGLHIFPWLMSLALPLYHAHFVLTIFPFIAMLAFSILVATVLHYGVEKPGIAFGKKLTKRLLETGKLPQAQRTEIVSS